MESAELILNPPSKTLDFLSCLHTGSELTKGPCICLTQKLLNMIAMAISRATKSNKVSTWK